MKRFAKKVIVMFLGWQVKRLRRKNPFKIIGVSGSIGKTSTKLAIASTLEHSFKVRYQDGNYNDHVSVPLIFFGRPMPSLFNPIAWLLLLMKNEVNIHRHYPYEVVVVEMGTDGPGQIKQFSKYLELDVSVVTAIAPEHMEFFKTIEEIANEEFSSATFSKKIILNADLCGSFMPANSSTPTITYGTSEALDYTITGYGDERYSNGFEVKNKNKLLITSKQSLGSSALGYSVCAAIAVANELGMSGESIEEGIKSIHPINGRLRRLEGINNTKIIDDTYNSSPVAANAGLDILYAEDAPQRIALLGNMNELGDYSKAAHEYVGEYCRPDKLDLVVTIGPDANKFLAGAAEKAGCKVARFYDPISAGEYIRKFIKPGAVILAKGSQNGVFAEEAVKILLANKDDEKFLVRQSPAWLKKKSRFITAI